MYISGVEHIDGMSIPWPKGDSERETVDVVGVSMEGFLRF